MAWRCIAQTCGYRPFPIVTNHAALCQGGKWREVSSTSSIVVCQGVDLAGIDPFWLITLAGIFVSFSSPDSLDL